MSAVAVRLPALREAFSEAFGRRSDGVWAAPGRVNLIGEHTDYNDGFVLPTAIDREVLAAVRLHDDGVVRCRSLDADGGAEVAVGEVGPGAVTGWPGYVLGVVWALREAGVEVPGLDVLVGSDVPLGAGLSSSAALECAVALAVADLAGATLDRTELAVAARRAETEVVGAPVGIMDQMAALHGRSGHALLLDCRSLAAEAVPLPLAEHGLRLVVIDTRVRHAHASGEYGARRRACAAAATALGVPALRDATLDQVQGQLDGELLRCARHVVTEDARVLDTVEILQSGHLTRLGPVFEKSHASMRDDFQISCPELDLAVASAVAAGAVAARMTGGGFGGCAVAVVPDQQLPALTQALARAFAASGLTDPDVFTVQPSDGAARVA